MSKYLLLVFFAVVLFLPLLGDAQSSVISLPNPLATETFEELIDSVINWLLVITSPIVVLLIVYSGFLMVIGHFSPTLEKQTSPENIRAARRTITTALMGYAIILLAKVFISVISGLFG